LKLNLEIFNKRTKAGENRDNTVITVTLPDERLANKKAPKKKVCDKSKSKRRGSRSIYSFTGIPFFFDVEHNRQNQAQTTTSVRNEILKDSKNSQDDISSIETYFPDTEGPLSLEEIQKRLAKEQRINYSRRGSICLPLKKQKRRSQPSLTQESYDPHQTIKGEEDPNPNLAPSESFLRRSLNRIDWQRYWTWRKQIVDKDDNDGESAKVVAAKTNFFSFLLTQQKNQNPQEGSNQKKVSRKRERFKSKSQYNLTSCCFFLLPGSIRDFFKSRRRPTNNTKITPGTTLDFIFNFNKMGSGASNLNATTLLASLPNEYRDLLKSAKSKPSDCSDITTVEEGQAEVSKWRRAGKKLLDLADTGKGLSFLNNNGANNGNKGKARKGIQMGRKPVPENWEKPVYEKGEQLRALLRKAVSESLLFKACTDQDLDDYVNAFKPENFQAGDVIIKQGDDGDVFYIVETGETQVYITDSTKITKSVEEKNSDDEDEEKQGGGGGDDEEESDQLLVNTLGPGASFGELALLYNTKRAATIKASTYTRVWSIDRFVYQAVKQVNSKAFTAQVVEFLQTVSIGDIVLSDIFSFSDFQKLATIMKVERYGPQKIIMTQGESGSKFYLILKGSVGVWIMKDSRASSFPGNRVVTLSDGKYFGEKALLADTPRNASVIADDEVTCLWLGRGDFLSMFGNLHEFEKDKKHSTSNLMKIDKSNYIECTMESIQSDFYIHRTLGKGAFGRVLLANYCKGAFGPKEGEDGEEGSEEKKTSENDDLPGRSVAIKAQSKLYIVSNELRSQTMTEFSISAICGSHPMIASFYGAFADNQFIYFLMEPCLGGELFRYLRHMGSFDEDWCRFYIGSVTLALQAMHSHGIVYRDLKPENLVLDSKGFLKLIDFGLGKKIGDDKSWTMCGTPDYLAPEMILNEGHTLSVDWWTLGILTCELADGAPPFYSDDPMETYALILQESFTLPSYFGKELKKFIKALVKKNVARRLGGSSKGANAVMEHPWFEGMEWDSLIRHDIKPPIVPEEEYFVDVVDSTGRKESRLPPDEWEDYEEEDMENNVCDDPDTGRPLIEILEEDDETGMVDEAEITDEIVEEAANWMPLFEAEED